MYKAQQVRDEIVEAHEEIEAGGLFDLIMPDGLRITLGRTSPRRGTVVALYSHGRCFEKPISDNIIEDAESLRQMALMDLQNEKEKLNGHHRST